MHFARGVLLSEYAANYENASSQLNWWYHLAIKYGKNYMIFEIGFSFKKWLDYIISKVQEICVCRKMALHAI